jgi:photosystem II stability/assembly factor-like uncharacterized protein
MRYASTIVPSVLPGLENTRVRILVIVVAAVLALSGCHRKADPPSEAPTGVTATPGDGLVVLSWDMLPDRTYWIFYEAGSSVAVAQPEATAIRRAISPRPVTGLANGTQYAFAMNATHEDSAAGPTSPVVTRAPRLAGDTDSWDLGAPLGTPPQNLKGITFNGSRFVVVGDATTIFAGDYNYTNPNPPGPPGVTAWMPPASLPTGFADNLSAVVVGTAYVALGTSGSVISSPDGLNWVLNTAVPAAGMNGIAFGFVNNVPTYVAVGDGSQIFTSTDLTQPWNPVVVSGLASDLKSVALVNGHFIATGSGGTLLTTDTPADGASWTALASNTTNTLRAVTFNAPLGLYAAVGDAGTIVTSSDLLPTTLWTAVPLTPPLAQSLLSVTVGGASASRLLAVGQGGTVVFCDVFCADGTHWSTRSAGSTNLNEVFAAPAMYVAVGDAGANAVSK